MVVCALSVWGEGLSPLTTPGSQLSSQARNLSPWPRQPLLPLRSERWVILGAVRDGGPGRGAAVYFPFGQRGSTVSGRQ